MESLNDPGDTRYTPCRFQDPCRRSDCCLNGREGYAMPFRAAP